MSGSEEQPSKVRKISQANEEEVEEVSNDEGKPDEATSSKQHEELTAGNDPHPETAAAPATVDTTAAEDKVDDKTEVEDEDEEELFSFFEKKDDDETHAPMASSTFIEDKGEVDEDSKTLLNSLESILAEERTAIEKDEREKKEEAKEINDKDDKEEAEEKNDKDDKEEAGNDKEDDKNVSRNLVIIDGLEIDIDELLKKDADEDQYYIDEMADLEDFDFDEDIFEGTQMYTFVDDDDDGLVDITDLNLPEPVPARSAADASTAPDQDHTARPEQDDEDQPALGHVTSTPSRPQERPRELMKINPRMLKQKYYEQAKVLWLEKIPLNQRNRFPLPRLQDLDNPRMWKHPTIPNAYYGGEGLHEWADRCHPMWQEYRDVDTSKHSYAQFVHHKWGYDRGIDVTRNLTRFSSCNDDDQGSSSVLACQYCQRVCFCSSGRKHKKPYLNPKAANTADEAVPPDRRTRMLVRKEDFQQRIKTLVEMQLNRGGAGATQPTHHQVSNAVKKAVNTIASSEEAFELALHYRQSENEDPTFTDDQTKELLSLEETLESFNIHYKSPYDDGDDEDGNNVEWDSRALQDY